MRDEQPSQRAARLVVKLSERYTAIQREAVSRAGCSSEGNPEDDKKQNAYVFEPRLKVSSVREQRALLLYVAQEGLCDALYPFLVVLQECNSKKKEPVFEKLNLAIQFLIDRRFNKDSPVKEAIEGILQYHRRSYLGNDIRLAAEVLNRTNLKLRVLQRSKATKSSLKRPKERAEPAHDWLPRWSAQYIPEESHFEVEHDPIWELLSPSEVVSHFRRLG